MAGLGRKTFIATEVLTAANVNGYLMDQTVMKYANTTAASSAVGTAISEGMTFYLSDTDEQVFYNGSSFAKQNGSFNLLLNSAFDVWQRGTSGTASGTSAGTGYNADRWFNYYAGAMTVSRQATGDTTNLPNIQYAARVQRNSGQTSATTLYHAQDIETVNSIPFAGKAVTFSFYARKGANYSGASSNLAFKVQSGTGTDQHILAGYTGSALVVDSTATLTTTWQRFTGTGTVGATATQLGVYFTYDGVGTAGAADYFEVTGVQLEAGSVATPFKRNAPTIALEEYSCKRYYQRWSGNSYMLGNAYYYNAGQMEMVFNFGVTMRVPPSISIANSLNAYSMRKGAGDDYFDSLSAVFGTSLSVLLYTTTGVSGTSGYAGAITFATSSALIEASAEL